MIRVIALTQFAFVALGSLASIILFHAQALAGQSQWRAYLATHALWLLLVPVLWYFGAEMTVRETQQPSVVQAIRASGVILAMLIAALYGCFILSA